MSVRLREACDVADQSRFVASGNKDVSDADSSKEKNDEWSSSLSTSAATGPPFESEAVTSATLHSGNAAEEPRCDRMPELGVRLALRRLPLRRLALLSLGLPLGGGMVLVGSWLRIAEVSAPRLAQTSSEPLCCFCVARAKLAGPDVVAESAEPLSILEPSVRHGNTDCSDVGTLGRSPGPKKPVKSREPSTGMLSETTGEEPGCRMELYMDSKQGPSSILVESRLLRAFLELPVVVYESALALGSRTTLPTTELRPTVSTRLAIVEVSDISRPSGDGSSMVFSNDSGVPTAADSILTDAIRSRSHTSH